MLTERKVDAKVDFCLCSVVKGGPHLLTKMGKEQEQSRRGEEDTRRALDEMLDSMGAEEYDPAVVAALEEYGRSKCGLLLLVVYFMS